MSYWTSTLTISKNWKISKSHVILNTYNIIWSINAHMGQNHCYPKKLGRYNWGFAPNTSVTSEPGFQARGGLTHWGRATHICVGNLTILGSDNGLSPGRRQAIIWTNAGILLIRTLGTNFSEIQGEIHSFSFSKMHLKMSSAKWRLFGRGLNELRWGWVRLTPLWLA